MVITMIDFSKAYYLNEDLYTDVIRLSKQYNELVDYVTVGRSHDNRDIVLIMLGLGNKKVLCTGGIHGRESINPIVLMKIIEFYAESYESFKKNKQKDQQKILIQQDMTNDAYRNKMFSSFVFELLQIYTFIFIPIANPDGYEIALKGFDCIHDFKLRRRCSGLEISAKEWKYNARGVDLNRNFPSKYWISTETSFCCDEKDKPEFSVDFDLLENETKTLIRTFHKYEPLCYIDFHSRGNVIYYYRNALSGFYNERQLRLANGIKRYTGYELMEPVLEVEEGDIGGNTVHYFSEKFGLPAFTIETVEDEADFPLDISYRQTVFHRLKYVILGIGNMLLSEIN